MSTDEFVRDVKKLFGWVNKTRKIRKGKPKKHRASKFWKWFDRNARK